MGGDIVMKLLTRHPARLLSAVVGGSGWLRPGLQFSTVWQNRGERFAAVPVGVTFVEGFFGDRPEWWVDYRDILNRNDLRALKGLASAVGE
jgi:pimeloyl-ACP methyl ester carboxylesterase